MDATVGYQFNLEQYYPNHNECNYYYYPENCNHNCNENVNTYYTEYYNDNCNENYNENCNEHYNENYYAYCIEKNNKKQCNINNKRYTNKKRNTNKNRNTNRKQNINFNKNENPLSGYCYYYLFSKCNNKNHCKYHHPSAKELFKYLKTNNLININVYNCYVPPFCFDYLTGRCNKNKSHKHCYKGTHVEAYELIAWLKTNNCLTFIC